MFSPYDFGYSWVIVNGHLIPLAIAAALVAFLWFRGRPRWLLVLALLVAAWSVAGFLVSNFVFRLNLPVEPPTTRFLASGAGRVLDAGAGSGRAAVGLLLTRPKATVVGLDIYSGYWGIEGNTPERFMANARIAGAADRAEARVGDLRDLPFTAGEFDAVISVAAIDHLNRAGTVKALSEVARVLKPRGEFLLTIVNTDWFVKLTSPHALAHHPPQDPARWRTLLEQAGMPVEEDGTQPGGLYFLARKAQ
jgi:SAM-dependent methyltransferase